MSTKHQEFWDRKKSSFVRVYGRKLSNRFKKESPLWFHVMEDDWRVISSTIVDSFVECFPYPTNILSWLFESYIRGEFGIHDLNDVSNTLDLHIQHRSLHCFSKNHICEYETYSDLVSEIKNAERQGYLCTSTVFVFDRKTVEFINKKEVELIVESSDLVIFDILSKGANNHLASVGSKQASWCTTGDKWGRYSKNGMLFIIIFDHHRYQLFLSYDSNLINWEFRDFHNNIVPSSLCKEIGSHPEFNNVINYFLDGSPYKFERYAFWSIKNFCYQFGLNLYDLLTNQYLNSAIDYFDILTTWGYNTPPGFKIYQAYISSEELDEITITNHFISIACEHRIELTNAKVVFENISVFTGVIILVNCSVEFIGDSELISYGSMELINCTIKTPNRGNVECQ